MRVHTLVGSTLMVFVSLFTFSAPVVAGGWATTDEIVMPDEIMAGEPFTIEFTLKQHGVTPVDWPDAYFTAMSDAGETVTFDAEPGDTVGAWSVDVTLPRNGVWTWDIQTNDLHIERSYHVLTLPRTSDVVAGISQSDLDSASAAMTGRIAALEEEQQALSAQIATLEAVQAESAENTPMAWWITALIAVVATALLIFAVIALAIRQGAMSRFNPEPRHVS